MSTTSSWNAQTTLSAWWRDSNELSWTNLPFLFQETSNIGIKSYLYSCWNIAVLSTKLLIIHPTKCYSVVNGVKFCLVVRQIHLHRQRGNIGYPAMVWRRSLVCSDANPYGNTEGEDQIWHECNWTWIQRTRQDMDVKPVRRKGPPAPPKKKENYK